MRFGYERQLDEYRDEVHGTGHRSLYGSDQKLRFYHQYGRQVPDVDEPDHADDLQQEFRYDALGRRVMVRNLHRPFCDPQERDCTHTIERYIWDGDQILWELRAPGDTSDNLEVQYGSGDEYGLVAYVNGRGIDAPLGIARSAYSPGGSFLLVPHLDWRGQWELGTDEEGERYPACGADPNCVRIGWPSTAVRSYMEKLGAEGEGDWVGSILRDQRDPSGFLYRRNRYYDPMAGRFTQPDPIGLAGGINLYGFAGGDPANFADPFGLCPPAEACRVLLELYRTAPYSEGGDLSQLRREAYIDLMAIGLRSGQALGVHQTVEGTHVDPRHSGFSSADPQTDTGLRGLAVDVAFISGVDVGTDNVAENEAAAELNTAVANAAIALPGVRAVIGPRWNTRSEVYGGTRQNLSLDPGHLGHFHISFYREDERSLNLLQQEIM
jgi:RHS repeat-associated protein